MAEARAAVSTGLMDSSRAKEYRAEVGDLWNETYILWMRATKRRLYRIRNTIRNGMWPTTLWNLGRSVIFLTAIQLYPTKYTAPLVNALSRLSNSLPFPKNSPPMVTVLVTSLVAGFGYFIVLLYVRRFTLRALLAYRGWMYEPPRKQSTVTLLWGAMVRVVTGSNPQLYSYQRSLPRMSVPYLRQTLKQLLDSLQPLYEARPGEFVKLCEEAQEFENNLGPTLQRALYIKSWLAPNYVSDWWEKYVYLMGRTPLPINSNYYIMDQSNWSPTSKQAARAAGMLNQLLTVKQMIERQTMEPLVIRDTIPVCMKQYERVFSTTRIPGEETDTIMHYDITESRHIAVYCKGVVYKMEVYDSTRRLLPPQTLQGLFQWIISDANRMKNQLTEAQKSVAALTTLGRTEWWRARRDYFSSGVNQESLKAIETAILFVSLVDQSLPFKDLSGRASFLLRGDGRSFWFDKSITMAVFEDGKLGLNCEHSFADAPVVAHVLEYGIVNEVLRELYTERGDAKAVPTDSTAAVKYPFVLLWEVGKPLENVILGALSTHTRNLNDLDHQVYDHDYFGKGFIKTCEVSPDAFIQMALQVTYLKNTKKFALTYEAAMTRLYLHGRTETVRSLTAKSAKFARAFLNPAVSVVQKQKLLVEACEEHQIKYKNAMNGLAIDRHLFALYVVSRGLGYDCAFLKKVLSIPWTLSTSQQPQQQIADAPDCNLPQYYNMMSPGGGFGPVSDEGYGVSYMVPGERRIFFHVSSKRSCPDTDSGLFMQQLCDTMRELKELFSSSV